MAAVSGSCHEASRDLKCGSSAGDTVVVAVPRDPIGRFVKLWRSSQGTVPYPQVCDPGLNPLKDGAQRRMTVAVAVVHGTISGVPGCTPLEVANLPG